MLLLNNSIPFNLISNLNSVNKNINISKKKTKLDTLKKKSKTKYSNRIKSKSNSKHTLQIVDKISKYNSKLTKSKVHKIIKKELKPHQKKIVDYITKPNNRSILLVHDTGTGKTLTSIASMFKLIELYGNRTIIIISPLSVIDNWKIEIANYIGYLPNNIIFLSYQSLNKQNENYCNDAIVIIDEVHNLRTNITSLILNIKGINNYCKKNNINLPTLKQKHITAELEYLLKQYKIPENIWLIPKSGVSAHNNIICAKKAFKLMLLTATPVINNISDLNNIFEMLTKRKFNLYTPIDVITNIQTYDVPISYYFIDKIPANGYPLTSPIYNLYVNLSPELKEKYLKYENSNNKLKLDVINHLRIVSNTELGPYYSPKIEKIIEILKSRLKKTLIYSFFIDKGMIPVTNMIINSKIIKQDEIYTITGKTSIQDRQIIVDKFNSIENGIILISSAGREGLNLKGVRYVFLLEPGWNDSNDHQALSRAIRYNSHIHLPIKDQRVDVFRLILKDTIDIYLLDKYVKRKMDINLNIFKIFKDYSIT